MARLTDNERRFGPITYGRTGGWRPLRAAVQALGGAKKVGCLLWPDLSADNASRKLLDALNPARAEKLDVSQVMFVFARAKEAGVHAPFTWFCGEIGYDSKPVTTAEEVDRLTTVIESSSKTLASAMATLERIQKARAG